ncbi:DUF2911 domain-containing protein [Dyadobacter tibetensis]|uniref:DUF2911 domain-containing protein n=1 Tax=Dyadobacter tibetensis TaxID=1211851 RepID=UPI0004704F78|nr:DUF2911 domain-containing protein [Dyadobacter tibetensis]
MKKKLSLFLLALTIGLTSAQAQIQTPQSSPAATVSQAIGLGTVTVNYSRPSLKGRKMFGHQLPYGQIWRTGANQITNLTLSTEMTIEGNKVPAGTYGLFTIPDKTEWTIILNKGADQWGAYTYKEQDDVLRFKVKAQPQKAKVEHFTIQFADYTPTSATLSLSWENTGAQFSISQDPKEQIMAQIAQEMAKTDIKSGTYLTASNYYYDNNENKEDIYKWAKAAVELDSKFWTNFYVARAAALNGKCEEAIKYAKAGLKMAQEAGDQAYVINNQSIIDQCSKK